MLVIGDRSKDSEVSVSCQRQVHLGRVSISLGVEWKSSSNLTRVSSSTFPSSQSRLTDGRQEPVDGGGQGTAPIDM